MSCLQNGTEEERKALNDLAREQLMLKILADVRFDIEVCLIEGWDYKELPLRIKKEMDAIVEKFKMEKETERYL